MNKPFAPPRLSPALAALRGVLGSRQALRPGGELEFVYEAGDSPWPAAADLGLAAGGSLWLVEAATVDFLAGNEVLAGLNPAELPRELLAAALALTFRPGLDRLGAALGWEIKVAEPGSPPAAGLEPLNFILNFDQESRRLRLALRLRPESETAGLALAGKVARFPAWHNPQSAAWPIPVTLVAGRMSLPLAELESLAVSDLLLPPDYPAADGRLTLILSGTSEISLSVRSGRAETLTWNTLEVTTVSDLNQPPDQPADGPASTEELPPNPAPPEVVITFELGKKLLPWGELEALAPGRSFPLDVDPLGPVTLTLNGRALAAGRLVDLGGVLGVEITRLLER